MQQRRVTLDGGKGDRAPDGGDGDEGDHKIVIKHVPRHVKQWLEVETVRRRHNKEPYRMADILSDAVACLRERGDL